MALDLHGDMASLDDLEDGSEAEMGCSCGLRPVEARGGSGLPAGSSLDAGVTEDWLIVHRLSPHPDFP